MHVRALLNLLMPLACLASEGVNLPPRASNAPGGAEFGARISAMDLPTREKAIVAEVMAGNVPDSWRHFAAVTISRTIGDQNVTAEFMVAPDYLAIGSNEDSLLTPLSPRIAQMVADRLGCVLPTRRMVDVVYHAATLKLPPAPIPPSPDMVKVQTWLDHQATIRKQRNELAGATGLVAGHKKDVVVTNQLGTAPGKVAIYGWHRLDGAPIQPLYLGHTESWVDYSHGIRLIARAMKVNGKPTTVEEVLAKPDLSELLSDEGVIANPRYPKLADETASIAPEKLETLTFEPGVRVVISSPANDDSTKPVRLILFALPSGNSIEQTIGRRINPGEDWHFEIQHIGAQTRWLRERLTDVSLVVAYLECEGKSWPAWRKKHDPNDTRIPEIVEALRKRFAGRRVRLVLTGHSGGGSLTFGFLNGVERIPDYVERIAFLDSDYAYDSAKAHADKLATWITGSENRHLIVIAYEDHVALLDGQTFVSEKGGTWGRSQMMRADLAEKFPFVSEADADWERHTALDGRVKFFMRKNPAKAVLHTRLVEFNGFIHGLLAGTSLENRDYTFLGARAYDQFITTE
jgi:hypothetical protein